MGGTSAPIGPRHKACIKNASCKRCMEAAPCRVRKCYTYKTGECMRLRKRVWKGPHGYMSKQGPAESKKAYKQWKRDAIAGKIRPCHRAIAQQALMTLSSQ